MASALPAKVSQREADLWHEYKISLIRDLSELWALRAIPLGSV